MSTGHAPRWLLWSAPRLLGAVFALGAAVPSSSAAPASPAMPSSSAAPSGSGPKSGPAAVSSPVATSNAAAPLATLPTIAGANIPEEPSSAPTRAVWNAAAQVRINRGAQGPCSASIAREWLRLSCPTWVGGGLVAGDPRGVTITALGNPFSDPTGAGLPQNRALTTVVLPLRRGEAKLFSFLQLAEEYNSSASAEAGMLSVVWRENRPDPMLGHDSAGRAKRVLTRVSPF